METIKQTVMHNEESIQALAKITPQLKPIKVRRIVMIALSVFLLVMSVYYFNHPQLVMAIVCLVIGSGALVYTIFFYNKLIVSTTIKQAETVKGRGVSYKIGRDVLKVNNDQTYTWDNVRNVMEVDNYVCIILKNNKTIMLDKRKLSDEQYQWVMKH